MSSNRASEPPGRVLEAQSSAERLAASASATASAITNSSSSAQAAFTGGLSNSNQFPTGPSRSALELKNKSQDPLTYWNRKLNIYLKVWSRSDRKWTVYVFMYVMGQPYTRMVLLDLARHELVILKQLGNPLPMLVASLDAHTHTHTYIHTHTYTHVRTHASLACLKLGSLCVSNTHTHTHTNTHTHARTTCDDRLLMLILCEA